MLFTKEQLKKLPEIYAQDGKGDKAIVHAIVTLGNDNEFFWLLTEYCEQDEVFFGFACLNDPMNAELGYISLYEVEKLAKEYPLKLEEVEMELADAKAKYLK